MFKKSLAILLAAIMAFELVGCGGSEAPKSSDGSTPANITSEEETSSEKSGSEETTPAEPSADDPSEEPEKDPGVEQWDKSKTLYCEYTENNILLNTEKYMIRADELWFQDSPADGKYLQLVITFENRTDGMANVVIKDDQDPAADPVAFRENETGHLQCRADGEEWNGSIGETEECRQGTYLIEIYGRNNEGSSVLEDSVGFDWYISRETPFVNVTVGGSEGSAAETTAGEEYDSFYSNAVIAKTDHYTLQLASMGRQQDENDEWRVRVDYKIINTSGSRYLLFDPGKQFAGYDPGRDWFDADESVFYSLEFTGKDKDDLTGRFSIDVRGYSWNGSSAGKLFEDTVNFTLRFDKNDPVVTGD